MRAWPIDCVVCHLARKSRALRPYLTRVSPFYGDSIYRHAGSDIALLRRDRYAELWPKASPPSLDVYEARVRAAELPDAVQSWLAYGADGTVAGWASVHPVRGSRGERQLDLYVHRNARRHGVGRALLRCVAAAGRRHRFDVVTAVTTSNVPAGRWLANKVNAFCECVMRTFEVPLSGNTPGMVDTDYEPSQFTFRLFEGRYPTDTLAVDIASLAASVSYQYGSRSTLPRGDDLLFAIRRHEEYLTSTHIERWTACAIVGDRCVAFNQYFWDSEEPHLLQHAAIAISSTHRSLALANALLRLRTVVCRAHPSIGRVRATRLARHGEESPSAAHGYVHKRWQARLVDLEAYTS